MAAGVLENPSLKNDEDIQVTLTSLELLSGQSFKRARDAAKSTGNDQMIALAEGMDNAREQMRGPKSVFSKYSATSTLVGKVEAGMEKLAQHYEKTAKTISDPAIQQQYSAIAQTLRTRMAESKEEMKGLKVKGSWVAPNIGFDKKELTFVQRITMTRGGDQNLQR